MNPKVEKLLKLPLYQRLLALAGLVVLVIGVFVWFVWLPEYDKLEVLDQEIVRLEADYIQKKQIADNLPKFKEEFAKMATTRATATMAPTQVALERRAGLLSSSASSMGGTGAPTGMEEY